nr:hypothetical protein [Aquabacterium sp.]
METDDLQALSTTQFTALSIDAISAMTTADIVAMTTAQILALDTAHIAAFNTLDIIALSVDHIQALDTNQIQAFTAEQMAVFETTDLAAFNMAQSTALTQPQLDALNTEQSAALTAVSPIVLDLNGDGVQTLSAARGVNFDLMGTGIEHLVGWVAPTDGLLVMDRNGDGQINDGKELFGTATVVEGHRAGDGYTAMRAEDSNHDGKLSASDLRFDELRIWVDANSDGTSQASELRDLAGLGIIELNLQARAGTDINNGNLLGLVSDYRTSDGHSHAMADVWFAKDQTPPTTDLAAPTLDLHVSDLLAPRAEDLLASNIKPNTSITAAPAVPPGDLHLAQVDHTQLTEDPNKTTPLI